LTGDTWRSSTFIRSAVFMTTQCTGGTSCVPSWYSLWCSLVFKILLGTESVHRMDRNCGCSQNVWIYLARFQICYQCEDLPFFCIHPALHSALCTLHSTLYTLVALARESTNHHRNRQSSSIHSIQKTVTGIARHEPMPDPAAGRKMACQ
jgi:hypothetical protein